MVWLVRRNREDSRFVIQLEGMMGGGRMHKTGLNCVEKGDKDAKGQKTLSDNQDTIFLHTRILLIPLEKQLF